MRLPLILALLAFWMFMAYRELARGDLVGAGLFALIGVLITAYRLNANK